MTLKKLLGLACGGALAVVILLVFAFYADYRAFLVAPMNVPESGIEFTVAPGDSIRSIAQRLAEQGMLRSSLYLRVYGRLSGQAARIKVGEYAVEAGTTPLQLMDKLIAGRVIQYALTVVEGWTFRQMLDAVHAHSKLEATLEGLDDREIMARLGHPDMHPEGRFFPDTYHFPVGTNDLDFLKRAFATMEQQLEQAWQQRVADLPLQSAYEALILASIIEKETAVASERREIAGVFIRRLRKGMLLQTDPTVIYGLGLSFDGNLRRSDLSADTPYNTYVHKGLPPTPIALPGADAIAAAVNPAPGDTLYFVAKGDGSHAFSKTLQEHARAVRQYQLNR